MKIISYLEKLVHHQKRFGGQQVLLRVTTVQTHGSGATHTTNKNWDIAQEDQRSELAEHIRSSLQREPGDYSTNSISMSLVTRFEDLGDVLVQSLGVFTPAHQAHLRPFW